MADVETPPAAEASQGKQQIVKPDKPDEDKYKEDLAKAEKEHTAAQDKLVGTHLFLVSVMRLRVFALMHRADGKLHRTMVLCPANCIERLQS
jgi:hypothetical protein